MSSNSTGVGLPKIETFTFNFPFSLTASTVPTKDANGPSITLTFHLQRKTLSVLGFLNPPDST